MKSRVMAATALLAVAVACATNPATGRRELSLMSEAEEIQLGRQSDAEIRKQMGVYKNEALQQYVSRIGLRLAAASARPALPWTFTVVDQAAVNAFALPGGFIYVTRGILPFMRDEAELAAVLGHEVGHVDARHGARAYSRQTLAGGGLALLGVFVPEARPAAEAASIGLGLLFLKHGRDAELESDRLGVQYVSRTGWRPAAVPALLDTLGRLDEAGGSRRGVPNWALTHPPAADRVVKVEEAVAAAAISAPDATATNRAEFERHLDGLVFGDSPEKGIVRGQDFLHPVLQFAVRFPAGWEVTNSDAQVLATPAEDNGTAIVLQLADATGGSVDTAAQASMARAGFQLTSGDRTEINGLRAYIGTYDGVMNNARVTIRAAHIQSGAQTYALAGIAPPAGFSRVAGTFDAAIRSFRPLSRQEADRIRPNTIDFYTVRSGDSWESLARATGGAVRAEALAIMNGAQPTDPPRAGTRIRIVVAG